MEMSTSMLATFPPFITVKFIVKGGNQHAMGGSFFSTFDLLGWKFPPVRLQHSHSLQPLNPLRKVVISTYKVATFPLLTTINSIATDGNYHL